MYSTARNYPNLNSLLAFALAFVCAQISFAQSTQNQQIVFEGTLLDNSGNAIDLSGASLKFYVSANGCYLYGESSSAAGDSSGNILHRIGAGSVLAGSPNSYSQNLFFGSATGTTTFAGNNCSVTASDTRLAEVQFGSITATITIGTVPYAYSATNLNGKTSADFVQISAVPTCTASQALAYNGSSFACVSISSAVNLSTGEVSGILPTSSLPSFSGDISTSVGSANATLQSIRGVPLSVSAPTAGQVLYYNGNSWAPTSIPSGSVSVTFGTSAGTAAEGNDSRITGALQTGNALSEIATAGFGASARSNLGLGSMATKNTVTLTTDVTGVLPWANGGSRWTNVTNGIYTASNTAIGTSTVTGSTKFLVETNSAGLLAARINSTNTAAYGLKIDIAGSNPNYYALNVNNVSGSMFMVQNDGRVGVGTMLPEARFHIASGTASMPPLKISSGPLTATAVNGAIEYDGNNLYLTNDSGVRNTIPVLAASGSLNISQITSNNSLNLNANNDIYINPQNGSGFGTTHLSGFLEVNAGANGETISLNNPTSQFIGFKKAGSQVGVMGHGYASYIFNNSIADAIGISGQYGVQLGTNYNAVLTVSTSGTVGIGTTSPRSTLDVSGGTITGSPAKSNAGSTVDYSTGNIQYTTGSCSAFQLNNLKDGAAYTFVVQGSTAATCSFTAFTGSGTGSLTVHLPPDHGATTASKHTIYSFFVAGAHVYFSWLPEM